MLTYGQTDGRMDERTDRRRRSDPEVSPLLTAIDTKPVHADLLVYLQYLPPSSVLSHCQSRGKKNKQCNKIHQLVDQELSTGQGDVKKEKNSKTFDARVIGLVHGISLHQSLSTQDISFHFIYVFHSLRHNMEDRSFCS